MLPSSVSKHIEKLPSGCWRWTCHIDENGYGRFDVRHKNVRYRNYAHREVYQCLIGDIPPGMELDHLCRVRHCVNPEHLEIVTPKENTRRSNAITAINARKTHCKYGHEFTENNIYVMQDGRACRRCRKMHSHNYNAKLKEQRRFHNATTGS